MRIIAFIRAKRSEFTFESHTMYTRKFLHDACQDSPEIDLKGPKTHKQRKMFALNFHQHSNRYIALTHITCLYVIYLFIVDYSDVVCLI